LLKLASGWWSDRLPRRKALVVIGYGMASVVRPLIGLAQKRRSGARHPPDGPGREGDSRALLAMRSLPTLSMRHNAASLWIPSRDGSLRCVIGPLVAAALLKWGGLSLRTVFLLAAIPAALAMIALIFGVKESKREAGGATKKPNLAREGLDRRFWLYLLVLLVFTLGNSTDALLILRATDLGVSAAMVPVLWAVLHVVKATSSTPAGTLSDRLGRRPLIIAGWLVYGAVYLGFAAASATWHAWALFIVYGLYFGLTEGVEKALVADLVPSSGAGRGLRLVQPNDWPGGAAGVADLWWIVADLRAPVAFVTWCERWLSWRSVWAVLRDS
jgi:MFS family permease